MKTDNDRIFLLLLQNKINKTNICASFYKINNNIKSRHIILVKIVDRIF